MNHSYDWISELKVGDKVIVDCSYMKKRYSHEAYEIREIVRITKASITVEGFHWNFNKRGESANLKSAKLRQYSPSSVRAIKRDLKPVNKDEAVIYCRVGSWEQANKNDSLQRQFETCYEWAKEHNIKIVGVWSEVCSKYDWARPIRDQAEHVAKNRGCIILIEAFDIWTRAYNPLYQSEFIVSVYYEKDKARWGAA